MICLHVTYLLQVLSVFLSCLCSNFWKPWPRNFVFWHAGMQRVSLWIYERSYF